MSGACRPPARAGCPWLRWARKPPIGPQVPLEGCLEAAAAPAAKGSEVVRKGKLLRVVRRRAPGYRGLKFSGTTARGLAAIAPVCMTPLQPHMGGCQAAAAANVSASTLSRKPRPRDAALSCDGGAVGSASWRADGCRPALLQRRQYIPPPPMPPVKQPLGLLAARTTDRLWHGCTQQARAEEGFVSGQGPRLVLLQGRRWVSPGPLAAAASA